MTTTAFKGYDVSYLIACTQPCELIGLDGYYGGPGGEFLQIHDSPLQPATGSVPVKSFFLIQEGALPSIYSTITAMAFQLGLFVGFSTTAGTYTPSSSEGNFFGDVANVESNVTYSNIGDFVTACASLQVWPSADGQKFIYNVIGTNVSGGATQYLLLFAKDNPVNGDVALASWGVEDGDVRIINFGQGGFSPFFSGQKGCTLVVSSTKSILTTVAGTPWTIFAQYA